MINLLPEDVKETLLYARRNRMLVKWVAAFFIGLIGIGAVVFAGQLSINQSTEANALAVQLKKDELAGQKLIETRKRTEEIGNSTKLALQVLSRQVLVFELLRQIGAVMPQGAALQSLSLSKLEGGIDLQAVAVNEQAATQVQINLADPDNKIFEKADILNISCAAADQSSGTDERYPCQIGIRALFAKDSQFIFTNTSSKPGAER